MMIPDVDNDSLVYLNGDFVRLGDARISVLDRGFIFGDGIYEVVPVYGGRPFRMEGHLARLERSLAAVRIDTGRDRAAWSELVRQMIERAPQPDCMIYLQVTRGVARRDHAFPRPAPAATVFCMVSPFKRPTQAQREQGLSIISIEDERWLRCDIKSISLLGNVLAKEQAAQAGVDEVAQFRDGQLTEGAACNVWVVQNGTLKAPRRNHLILEGVRYGLLAELAHTCGIPFAESDLSRDDVAQADEIMLSSASKEVLPVVRYDDRPVADGRPGPVYARLRAAYDALLV